jgi:hypothetical protein
MTVLSSVDKCANPKCEAKFKRLGEGKLSVFRVGAPELWGFPFDTKQKVVWLCANCSQSLYVRADYHHKVIKIIHKERGAAA